ncbi:UNVERIFIED_CONTAM: hypothetical protein Slati_1946200 [Sesamum latifolium]|uniref:Uncharacterized protein n=1 Tax=Sesamum latifolium TaxID=2727402 RepID=A0AAW2X2U6_9LAMI
MAYEACMKNGEMGLEKVELRHGGPFASSSTLVTMITSFLHIILSALLGDPTFLVSSVLVELVSHALQ